MLKLNLMRTSHREGIIDQLQPQTSPRYKRTRIDSWSPSEEDDDDDDEENGLLPPVHSHSIDESENTLVRTLRFFYNNFFSCLVVCVSIHLFGHLHHSTALP